MKKIINTLTLASIASLHLASVGVAQADIAGFEVGAYKWTPDYKGTMSATESGGLPGTTIDLQDDLGFSDASHNIIWFSLEHPVPVVPNIKVVSSDLSNTSLDGSSAFTFNGEVFVGDVDTTFDMSNIEYTLYYEILDNWINVDLGLTFRQYDGMVEISTDNDTSSAREDLDFTIPLLYVAARADLPFTGFFVDGQINTISAGGNSLTDTTVGLGYESDIGLGAKAGYRTFEMNVDEDGFDADLEFSGAYISVFYHF